MNIKQLLLVTIFSITTLTVAFAENSKGIITFEEKNYYLIPNAQQSDFDALFDNLSYRQKKAENGYAVLEFPKPDINPADGPAHDFEGALIMGKNASVTDLDLMKQPLETGLLYKIVPAILSDNK